MRQRRVPGILADLVVCIDPRTVHPPHEPYRLDDLFNLTESMKRVGWLGRPLPVQIYGGELWSTCGSHRIQAARDAGLEGIPILIQDRVPKALSKAFDDFMMIDQAVDDFLEIEGVNTWNWRFLRSLKKEGFHAEVIELLKINQWDCSR